MRAITNSEFVLEFVIHNVVCKNTSVRSSPMIVSLPGCPDITLNAKSATVCKITYEKGKRVSFSHSHLLNLKASFVMVQGHGDQTIRASCSFDFFEIVTSADEQVATIYDVEIGMDKPGGERFGIMNCSFQLMPVYEFESIGQVYPSSRPSTSRLSRQSSLSQTRGASTSRGMATSGAITSRGISTGGVTTARTTTSSKRISVSRAETPRDRTTTTTRQTPYIPELNLHQAPLSSRSQVGSIHERYMKKNEMWIGHHCSTHSETDNRRSRIGSRTSSRQSTARMSAKPY